jgi:hypothetical protein
MFLTPEKNMLDARKECAESLWRRRLDTDDARPGHPEMQLHRSA